MSNKAAVAAPEAVHFARLAESATGVEDLKCVRLSEMVVQRLYIVGLELAQIARQKA